MKRIISLLLVIVLCAGLFSCMPNLRKYAVKYAEEHDPFDTSCLEDEGFVAFIDKINTFAINMSKSISNTSTDNFCIAPASLFVSLASACESANGETRAQILSALDITYEELEKYTKLYFSFCNKQFTYTNNYGSVNVSAHENLVNSVWISSEKEYDGDTVNKLTDNYYCNVFSAPFNERSSINVMNQYITYISHNIIDGHIDFFSNSDLSFISTYHLKEIWNEFGKSLSLSLDYFDFVNADKTSVSKQLLRSTYVGGQVIDNIKYTAFHVDTEHNYRIHFIVPSKIYTLDDVFTPQNIAQVLSTEDYRFIDNSSEHIHYTRTLFPEIDVSFKDDVSPNLKDDFGIVDLFDSEICDLSNLINGKVSCNSFLHASRMRLNAKGIEGESINLAQSEKTPENLPDYEIVYHDFVVNKAFGFVMTDPNGAIIYIGRVNSIE